jgi:flavorubredoxin
VVLIDNAYPGTFPELYARIENAFQQEGREVNIDVIVQNHVEKDHSGLLVELHEKSLKHLFIVLKLQYLGF